MSRPANECMPKLTVILITLDEEKNLARCLESVKWADEIVVVDSYSRDRTKEIARSYTDKIFDLKWPGFGAAKKFALEKANGEWVLSIDADELVSESLQAEIRQVINSSLKSDGYYLPRLSFFLGKWIRHGGWYPDYVLRLFRKQKARFTDSLVHEEVILNGKAGYLKADLLHYTVPDLERYLVKMNRYTSLSAQELSQKGKRTNLGDIFFRPPAVFLKMYFWKLALLDGFQGFLLAIFSSFHVLAKYCKLWYIGKSKL